MLAEEIHSAGPYKRVWNPVYLQSVNDGIVAGLTVASRHLPDLCSWALRKLLNIVLPSVASFVVLLALAGGG